MARVTSSRRFASVSSASTIFSVGTRRRSLTSRVMRSVWPDTLISALERSVHSLQDVFPVVRGEQMVGSVTRGTLMESLQLQGESYLQGVMTRTLHIASPDEPLVEALRRSAALGASELIPVVEDANAIQMGLMRMGHGHRLDNVSEYRRGMQQRIGPAIPEEVPTGVGFMRRTGLVTEGRPEEFEALAGRCAVFRLDGIQQP